MSRILEFFGDILTGTGKDDPAQRRITAEVSPNPSVGAVHFRFNLEETASVRLDIFDLTGRNVASVADRSYPAGYHTIDWDPREAGLENINGIYFYRLAGLQGTATGKLILVQ